MHFLKQTNQQQTTFFNVTVVSIMETEQSERERLYEREIESRRERDGITVHLIFPMYLSCSFSLRCDQLILQHTEKERLSKKQSSERKNGERKKKRIIERKR